MPPHLDLLSQLVFVAESIQVLAEATVLSSSAQGTDAVEELQLQILILDLEDRDNKAV